MKTSCMSYRQQLVGWADEGQLSGPLADHVRHCHACRAEWDTLQRLGLALSEALTLPASQAATDQRVWERLEQAPAPVDARRFWFPAGAVAGLAVVAAIVFALSHAPKPSAFEAAMPEVSARGTSPASPHQPERHISGPQRNSDPQASTSKRPSRLVQSREALPLEQEPRDGGGLDDRKPTVPLTDEQYLDGRDASLLGRWSRVDPAEQRRLEGILKQLPPPADDFVRIPLPRLAALGGQRALIDKAVKDYKHEAAVVDTRLYRQVTLQAKGEALSEVIARLKTLTGVDLSASRGVADEKVTIFVKDVRARDLMRAVARLFGYHWARTGGEGAYRYQLIQDLRSRLAEEELRNRDQNMALLALDAEMEKYRPFLDLTFDQLKDRWEKTKDNRLWNAVMGGGWGGMKLYYSLSEAERAAMLTGQDLMFRPDHANPERRLPEEWQSGMLGSWTSVTTRPGGSEYIPVGEVPGVKVTQLRLQMVRTELGKLTLKTWMTASWGEKGRETQTFNERELAVGQSPSTANPDNAAANAALKGKAPFDRTVSLKPESSCPHYPRGQKRNPLPQSGYNPLEDIPHVQTADVWEEVHRVTGLPIVADYYSRLFPERRMAVNDTSLFDALCKSGDNMGVRWTKDGDFLLGRSTSYFWDKLKEVPNRHLQRWAKHRDENGGLPLADFLEMAQMPDQQLDSQTAGEVIIHCWGLRNWWALCGEQGYGRPGARFIPELTPDQLRLAMGREGVPLTSLSPAQQQGALAVHQAILIRAEQQGSAPVGLTPEAYPNAFFQVRYVPAGWFMWERPEGPYEFYPRGVEDAAAQTPEELMEKMRAIYAFFVPAVRTRFPQVKPEQLKPQLFGRFNAGIAISYPARGK